LPIHHLPGAHESSLFVTLCTFIAALLDGLLAHPA